MLDRAEQMLARAARKPGTYAGALFIDIDGFKHVNDNLGHAAGDQLLRVVGEAAAERRPRAGHRRAPRRRRVRRAGRVGAGEATLNLLADRLTEVLREPVELEDGRKLFSVTASIGVAIGRYETPDALLRDADLALYSAKAAGKDRYALFDAEHVRGRRRTAWRSRRTSARRWQEDQFFLALPADLRPAEPARSWRRGAAPLAATRSEALYRPTASSRWPRTAG